MSSTTVVEGLMRHDPIVGCSIVSPGCTNCYAMKMAHRIERSAEATGLASPYAGTTKASKSGVVWTGKVALADPHTLLAPLRWRKPRRIFVNSMGDLFHESVPDAWIDQVFAVMALAPQHTFQILTKRSKRMREYLRAQSQNDVNGNPAENIRVQLTAWLGTPSWRKRHPAQASIAPMGKFCARISWPLPNVWLGVSSEDQARANERIPDLLATPAAVRFVSAEPLLGEVDLRRVAHENGNDQHYYHALDGYVIDGTQAQVEKLDWVIVGGESGHGARPMHPDWAQSIRDQCAAAGVPFFFKQWGEFHPIGQALSDGSTNNIITSRWGWNHEARSWRVGKSRAGRLLDGIEHNAFPET